MPSKKRLPKFSDVRRITVPRDVHVKSTTIHITENVFPVGFHWVIVSPNDLDAGQKIKHIKGQSAVFFTQILALRGLERLEVRQDRFTMDFIHEKDWMNNFDTFKALIEKHFLGVEVRVV